MRNPRFMLLLRAFLIGGFLFRVRNRSIVLSFSIVVSHNSLACIKTYAFRETTFPTRVWPVCRYDRLNQLQLDLREAGDEADVDTRSLPLTWRLDHDWLLQGWREKLEVPIL